MEILGDSNATLKDLTRIVEAELMGQEQQLYPLICSEPGSEDEAYVKIPIQTRVAWPSLFDGERKQTSTEVNVIASYTKGTYELTLGFDSDLIREAKAYTFADKTQEATISFRDFPSYNLTNNVIVANINAYDGKAFYANNHKWANVASAPTINNTVAATGQTVTALWADLQTAVAQLRTFMDDKGRLLNPRVKFGRKQLLIHCPAALGAAFTQLLNQGFFPMSAPVTTSGTAAVTASGPTTIGEFEGVASLHVDGYLDSHSTTAWYLHYVGMPQKPFLYTESYPLQFKALGFGTEYETMKNQVAIAGKHRWVQGTYRFDRSIRIA